jgi:hypothetical protein
MTSATTNPNTYRVQQQSMYEIGSDWTEHSGSKSTGKNRRRGSRGRGGLGQKALAGPDLTTTLGEQPEVLDPAGLKHRAFRQALSKKSALFLANVIECLKLGALGPGIVFVLVEQRAWEGAEDLRLALRDYIISHPKEVCRICASLIESHTIVVDVDHTIEIDKITRDWHWYKATATVIATQQRFEISGDGPSFKQARAPAYQQFLLKLCEFDVGSELKV